MGRAWGYLAAVGILAGWVGWALAEEDSLAHRRSLGNLKPDSYTAGRAIQGSDRPQPGEATGGVPTWVIPQPDPGRRVYPGHPRYRVYYPPVYGYPTYYGYPPPYPLYRYYPRYSEYHYYYGPVFVPAETLYGPQAVQRFIGVRP